eukprot:279377_1
MIVLILTTLLVLLAKCVNGINCNYGSDLNIHWPAENCIYSESNLSYYLTCYGEQLYEVEYYDINCTGIPYSNKTSTLAYNCSTSKKCDYVTYSVYHADINGIVCDNINGGDETYSMSVIINECLYEASSGYYRLDTCVYDSIYSTAYYFDADCIHLVDTNIHRNDKCNNDDLQYFDITECTQPLNDISTNNDCGYIQGDKSNLFIFTLDHCYKFLGVSDSWLFTCLNDEPYWYIYENSTICDSSIVPDSNSSISESVFSYSCSKNKCDYAEEIQYDTNNCQITNQTTILRSLSVITSQCFNWFEDDNSMRSTKWKCDETSNSMTKITYNDKDCDEALGILKQITSIQSCSNTIQCNNSLTIDTPSPLAPSPIFIIKNGTKIYISANGTDDNVCGKKNSPCGTLLHASRIAKDIDDEIEYIIQGQNKQWISRSKPLNPCIPLPISDEYQFDRLTITFDTNYIHEMKDWYDTSLCDVKRGKGLEWNTIFFKSIQSINQTTLIINNLLFNSYSFDGRSSQQYYIAEMMMTPLICNNCKFSNITISGNHHNLNYTENGLGGLEDYSALIVGSNLQFYECLFENISYIPFGTGVYKDEYKYDYSFIKIYCKACSYYNIVIGNNSYIHNIYHLHSFVNIFYVVNSAENAWPWKMNFYDAIFNEISVMDSLIYHRNTNSKFDLTMSNLNFFNMNFGSILNLQESYKQSIINIHNVNISTSQTIEQYIATKELYGIPCTISDEQSYSLFIFNSISHTITIQNVHVKYDYASYMKHNCKQEASIIEFWETINNEFGDTAYWLLTYYCNIPIQFLYSISSVNITQLTVRNDITDKAIELYKKYIIESVFLISTQPHDTIYIDIQFNDDQFSIYSFIYNKGILNIESFYVYGSGIHYSIIKSPQGALDINELIAIPSAYCTTNIDINKTCKYDANALQIAEWIVVGNVNKMYTTTTIIKNSFIYGTKGFSIVLKNGNMYLQNVTIEMSTFGIWSLYTSQYLEIKSCQMKDIGVYYSSRTYLFHQSTPITKSVFSPFNLNSLEIWIEDTTFSYIDHNMFDMFALQTTENIQITLINNTFEINDVNVVEPFPIQLNKTWAYLINLIGLDDTYTNFTVTYFTVNGMMPLINSIHVTLIDNTFRVSSDNLYVIESTLINENIPWIYIDNGHDEIICFSGNEFTNFAIWIKNSTITSCVRPDLMNYVDLIDFNIGPFGGTDTFALEYNKRQPNIFEINNDSLFSVIYSEDNPVIALINNIFSINISYTSKTINIFNGINTGNYLFVDNIIEITSNNTINYDFKINEQCDVTSYYILDNIPEFLTLLRIFCDEINNYNDTNLASIHDNIQPNVTNHWSPYLITVESLNNDTYYPGGKLELNHSIIDAFGNQISKIDEEIIVNIHSTNSSGSNEFFSQISIDETGICLSCMSGLAFTSITLSMIKNEYTLQLSVQDNVLILTNNTLNIEVIECPSGYGATTTTEQCDICNTGYYNLLPTCGGCIYCDEDTLDGITCVGSDNVMIEYNHWSAIKEYSDINQEIFADNEYIVSSRCPGSYCCQLQSRCHVINDNNMLCANNRDVNTPLCGQCLDGYSEAYGTTDCIKCNTNYYERLLIPITYGFLLCIFILYTKSKKILQPPNDKSSKCDKLRCCKIERIRKFDTNGMSIMVTQIIFYHYQSVSFILTTSVIQSNLVGFVNLFNLDIFSFVNSDGDDTEGNGFCLMQNMIASQKILFQLTTTASILFFIAFPYLLSLLCSINVFSTLKRKPNFSQTFMKATLICIGQILYVSFKLISCRQIGNISVHYYFGSDRCYGYIWILSLIFVCSVTVLFLSLFVWIFQQRRKSKEIDVDKSYYELIRNYNDRYWYWEGVLFFRRLLISLIFIVFDEYDYLKTCLNIILIFYLYIHSNCNPFQVHDVNKFEFLSLGCLIAIIFIVTNDNASDSNIKQIIHNQNIYDVMRQF